MIIPGVGTHFLFNHGGGIACFSPTEAVLHQQPVATAGLFGGWELTGYSITGVGSHQQPVPQRGYSVDGNSLANQSRRRDRISNL